MKALTLPHGHLIFMIFSIFILLSIINNLLQGSDVSNNVARNETHQHR